jgi:hypothetical protein
MSLLQNIGFGAPWVLIALAVLPAIWWLLKVTPPAAKRVHFPAVRLLLGLPQTDETPAHTPFWLLLLRLIAAGLIVLALSDPFISPGEVEPGSGPIIVAVDNGWASAHRWDDRANTLREIAQRAERANRPLIVLPTAESDIAPELRPVAGADAQGAIKAVTPQPYSVNRPKALEAVKRIRISGKASVIWLADGVDEGNALSFATGLSALGDLTIFRDTQGNAPIALAPPEAEGGSLRFSLFRSETDGDAKGTLRALSADGRLLSSTQFKIPAGSKRASAIVDLPSEMRNALTRVELADRSSAGTVVLIDERWRRRPVGLMSGQTVDTNQPLLSDLYYIERALAPYAELRRGPMKELLGRGLSVLMLTDISQIVGEDRALVVDWIEKGGLLVRFSGPKLAAQSDDLIPGRLRSGGRLLGGSLSWEKPQVLAPFPQSGPFAGLAIPQDVTVGRQVLSETVSGGTIETWAHLGDGTPLVTAQRRGKGFVILFHVTANTEWSNLPLSGLFVEMLRRVVSASAGLSDNGAAGAEAGANVLSPVETLDGFGRLVPPPGSALPIHSGEIEKTAPGPRHPPGLYGEGGIRRALNLFRPNASIKGLPPFPPAIQVATFGGRTAMELKYWLLAIAVMLMLLDGFAALALRGLIGVPSWGRRVAAPAVVLALAIIVSWVPREARADDTFALRAALETHLAYVMTGDPETDMMTKAGLQGLSRALRERTAIEPAEPIGLNIETDELAFFPLIYWPIASTQKDLSPTALAKIDKYMKQGGTIFFDTRDQNLAMGSSGGRQGPGSATLRRMLGGLDVPPLEPLAPEHVLTKTFYLLQDFPGRWIGGRVWVEAHGGSGATSATQLTQGDGVSPIVIGSHDWAAAWARDEFGRSLAAVTPGGEQQREMALRFGVNLVMYALTGNYKTDQVHVPAILERLGQ